MEITNKDIGKRCSVPHPINSYANTGKQIYGTIVDIYYSEPKIGVRFDDYNTLFHNCGGTCENNYGYYIHSHEVEFIDESISRCDSIW